MKYEVLHEMRSLLHDREFKIIVMKMLINSKRKTYETSEKFNAEKNLKGPNRNHIGEEYNNRTKKFNRALNSR